MNERQTVGLNTTMITAISQKPFPLLCTGTEWFGQGGIASRKRGKILSTQEAGLIRNGIPNCLEGDS